MKTLGRRGRGGGANFGCGGGGGGAEIRVSKMLYAVVHVPNKILFDLGGEGEIATIFVFMGVVTLADFSLVDTLPNQAIL